MNRRTPGLLLLASGSGMLVYRIWHSASSIAAMRAKSPSSDIGFAPLDLWPSSWLWAAIWTAWMIAGAVLVRRKRLSPSPR